MKNKDVRRGWRRKGHSVDWYTMLADVRVSPERMTEYIREGQTLEALFYELALASWSRPGVVGHTYTLMTALLTVEDDQFRADEFCSLLHLEVSFADVEPILRRMFPPDDSIKIVRLKPGVDFYEVRL